MLGCHWPFSYRLQARRVLLLLVVTLPAMLYGGRGLPGRLCSSLGIHIGNATMQVGMPPSTAAGVRTIAGV